MITKETYMFCDFCYRDFCPDLNHLPGYEIRKFAKKAGWKYINGKDKCPRCISNKAIQPAAIERRPANNAESSKIYGW